MNLWSVEHFFDIFFIKIRFSSNQNIGEGESNFDEKMSKKCSTYQRFIRKRNTTNKIGTLIEKKIFFADHKQGDWKQFFQYRR